MNGISTTHPSPETKWVPARMARNLYLALYDPAADLIRFAYFVDEHEGTSAPYMPGRGLTEYVLRTGRPLLASPEVFDELARAGEVAPIGVPAVDWLGAPLVAKGSTIWKMR